MSFNLDDYEPVATRLDRWWKDHASGRVLTKLVHADESSICVRAELYRDADDERPYASGYAEETRTGHVNATSALENGETSSIGRALANAGYAGSDPAKRASREEMAKVNRGGAQPPAESAPDPWLDLIRNPDQWFDNRVDKKNPKAPDFKAKATNPAYGKAGEPYKGKPAGLALWLRDAPDGFGAALAQGDESLLGTGGDEAARARGKTVAEAVDALGGDEVPPPTDDDLEAAF